MESADAKAFVDNLYQDVYAHWDKRINHGAFMTQLRAGTLPLPCLRRFFKDWGLFSIEVVALNAVSYYVHLPFFVDNYDLLPAFSDKIAEELIAPKPPGHILILLETAKSLHLSKEELFEEPASAAGRAISDYCRRMFQDGSLIELWGTHAYEETLGHWAHAEADLVQHEERMGHGPLNRMILQRIVEQGKTAKKLGYDPKYCAYTMVDLHALMEQNALENPYPL